MNLSNLYSKFFCKTPDEIASAVEKARLTRDSMLDGVLSHNVALKLGLACALLDDTELLIVANPTVELLEMISQCPHLSTVVASKEKDIKAMCTHVLRYSSSLQIEMNRDYRSPHIKVFLTVNIKRLVTTSIGAAAA